MLGGFLSIIPEGTCCSYGECTEYIPSDIPWYSAMYNTTGLKKHSETDVVEEVFVDQLGPKI
jgi:hypothetical protein